MCKTYTLIVAVSPDKMGRKRRPHTAIQQFILIVLTFCVLGISGGIPPDKTNDKDNFPDDPDDFRTKRQDGDMYYTSVCEGRTMDLRCPPGRYIDVEWANFGRTDTETCVGYGPIKDTNCRSEGASFEIVSQMCDNKASCSIQASTSLFGDPCPGTFKLLEVQFECVVAPTTTIGPTTTPIYPTTNALVALTTAARQPTRQPTRARTRQPTMANTTPKLLTTKLNTQRPPLPIDTTSQPTVKGTTEGVRTTPKKIRTAIPVPSTTQLQTCAAVIIRGVSWPEALSGSPSKQPCPEGSTGEAVWHCEGHPPRWFPETGPDLSSCVSVWVQDLTRLVGSGAPTSEVTDSVLESVESTQELYGGDIIEITEILDNSVETLENEIKDLEQPERETKTKEVTENYVEITSSMLEMSKMSTWEDLTKTSQSDTASHLITSLEESAFLLANNLIIGSTVSHEDNNVALEVEVQDVESIDVPVLQFPRSSGMLSSKMWQNITDSIAIPTESIKQRSSKGLVKVVFLAYNNLEELLGTAGAHKFITKTPEAHKFKTKTPDTGDSGQVIVNSRILSASINDPRTSAELVKPAKITFEHKQTENVSDPACAFWHFVNGSRGEWSDEGCVLITTNKTHTTCECSHLTNFAIIMNVRGIEIPVGHHFALSVITYVGFIISVVCLLMAFVTFSFFKNIQNDRNTIHKNLVLCLLIAEIVFLAGINQTAKQGVCTAVALMLHYFFLASFCWMCLEGIQLYVMLVEVFEAESSRRKYYYPFGYGLPLFIVGVSAAIDFHSYGTDDYCWLAVDNNFIWAFVAPVCIVILVNTVFLTMAIVIMCRHSTMQTNPKEKSLKEKITNGQVPPPYMAPTPLMATDKIVSWLRGALVLLCLLGITWAFGLMYVSENLIVFAYIFTIANSFQGLFIFIFHCCMNDKILKEYRRYVRNNDWIPDCIQRKYGGSYGSNQAQSYRSSSSNGKRAAKDEARRISNTTGSSSFERDRKFSASSYRNSGEYQGVKFTSIVVKPENQLENQRLSDEGIGLEIDDIQSPAPNDTSLKETTPDVSSSNSLQDSTINIVEPPPVLNPVQAKLGSAFEKQPLLNESPLRVHSPSEPDGYQECLPIVENDTQDNTSKGMSMPDLVFASSPWKVRKLPPSPIYSPQKNSGALNQSLPNLPHSPIVQKKRLPLVYRRLNSESLSSPWAPRTPKPEAAIAIDNGPVEMVGYRKLKLETII